MTHEQAIRILDPYTTLESYTHEVECKYPDLIAKGVAYDQACLLACEVIQRELGREKGCEHCDENYFEEEVSASECFIGIETNRGLLHVTVRTPLYEDMETEFPIRFCPMCGKQLKGCNQESNEQV